MKRGVLILAAIVPAILGLVVYLVGGFDPALDDTPSWAKPVPFPDRIEDHSRGGSVRVAVLTPPEMIDQGSGGDTLRQLVLPSLFVAQPDGTWRASLVEPGTDRATKDGRSASFRLRKDARWSDGTPINAEDLRRTADSRFVASVDASSADGTVTVRFVSKLPNWRHLWSGERAISEPRPNVYGGAFLVRSTTSGLETVLTRNNSWYGGPALPFLSSIHLVLAADPTMARQLLGSGQVDAYDAPDDTVRTQGISRLPGVSVARKAGSGRSVGLRLDTGDLSQENRRRVAFGFPRKTFVNTLLHGEARALSGLSKEADGVWDSGADKEGTTLASVQVTMVAPADLPLSSLLLTSVERSVKEAQGSFVAMNADTTGIEDIVSKMGADVVLDVHQDGPEVCWLCRFSGVDDDLARLADSGDTGAQRTFSQKLRTEGRYLPLWRADAVVGWRNAAVRCVAPNGYTAGSAWNAERWWSPQALVLR